MRGARHPAGDRRARALCSRPWAPRRTAKAGRNVRAPLMQHAAHRVLLRVRSSHAGVVAEQEGVLHVRVEHSVHGPLHHVMHLPVLLAPHPADAHLALAMVVQGEAGRHLCGAAGWTGWRVSRIARGGGAVRGQRAGGAQCIVAECSAAAVATGRAGRSPTPAPRDPGSCVQETLKGRAHIPPNHHHLLPPP